MNYNKFCPFKLLAQISFFSKGDLINWSNLRTNEILFINAMNSICCLGLLIQEIKVKPKTRFLTSNSWHYSCLRSEELRLTVIARCLHNIKPGTKGIDTLRAEKIWLRIRKTESTDEMKTCKIWKILSKYSVRETKVNHMLPLECYDLRQASYEIQSFTYIIIT